MIRTIGKQLRLILLAAAVLAVPMLTSGTPASAHTHADPDLAQYVDPLIGTAPSNSPNPVPGGAGGSTFPGAIVPFGMVQFSPDTPNGSPSGYGYQDAAIEHFSLTHFNGAGCPNHEDIPLLPVTGPVSAAPDTKWANYRSSFTHDSEVASPGYYKVRLAKYDTLAELSATTRTGFARFTYPATTQASLLVGTGGSATGERSGSLTVVGSDQLDGTVTAGGFCGSSKTFKIHFSMRFDRPFTSSGTWLGNAVTAGSQTVTGTRAGGYVTFDTTANPVVQMKIGLSFVSVANAQANLAAESPGWDFAAVRDGALVAWNKILNRVRVAGGTADDMAKFYTALYHVLLNPNISSDVNGEYMGFDHAVHTAGGMTVYQNYSGWDIYRSWIQLVSLIAPRETTDIVKSMVLDGQQGGELPKWSQQTNEDFVMTGDPGPIIVSSAYAFGVRDFDTAAALELMHKVGSDPGANAQGNPIRGNLTAYLDDQFISGEASDSLEYSASDFAIAQFARALGDSQKYHRYMRQAQWWLNVFNPASNYINPRYSQENWVWPLSPAANDGFTEGNAAQYTWMVPYNLHSLIDLMHGPATAIQRLDHLFTEVNAGLTQPYFYIGNEPEFATPWAYNFAGAPWKTQQVVRRIVTESFTADPGGLPGNDDLGAMSSWLVWAYLGLYPATPGADTLALHGPAFTSATIDLGNGHSLQINGAGAADDAPFVQSLAVDGKATTRTWLHYSEIAQGATLDFTMGGEANPHWGNRPADEPPSFTDDFVPPPAAPDLGPNLALGKTATGSMPCGAAEAAANAVDGSLMMNSKWCSLASPKWLQVDLGASTKVGAFMIKHAGLGGETSAWNTKDFNIQVSTDGTEWKTVLVVAGNTSSITVNDVPYTQARYVKLNVTRAENCCGSGATRIYELEVYGTHLHQDVFLPRLYRN